jgi:4-hydroxy-tetrahydrodipicolinate synthase
MNKKFLPKGFYTALITPFQNGELDRNAWELLVDRQVSAGIAGLVPVGCTGEAAALSLEEREWMVRKCVEIAAGRCAVVAGSGTNVTAGTIDLSRLTAEWGVDALMLISPYYNKPQQHGLVAHYRAVARAVDIPQIIYNVPGRTAVNILPSTVAELVSEPNIIAVKEASGDLDQVKAMAGIDNLQVFSGEDGLNLPIFALGAAGAISVLSNILPRTCAKLWQLWTDGDLDAANAVFQSMQPVVEMLFCETNPAPAKMILALMGLCEPEPRLPVARVAPETEARLRGFYMVTLSSLLDGEVR